jgi:hypothetical protein
MPTEQDKLSSNCMTCQVLDNTEHHKDQKKGYAREERDDEVEFTRIPIAGENSEDYHTDYDTDSDGDETHNVFTQNMNKIKLNEDSNATRTNDNDDHAILPIVEPLSTYTYSQALTGIFTTTDETSTHIEKALTADDIAFLIGHADGVVQTRRPNPQTRKSWDQHGVRAHWLGPALTITGARGSSSAPPNPLVTPTPWTTTPTPSFIGPFPRPLRLCLHPTHYARIPLPMGQTCSGGSSLTPT